ncbi:uncharacterized protein LOC120081277 isoform X2 [Benincasa hispida]|uniref:uncharacterized protein LOC120081277 isoform X2 n=1 Tax=Benincasa hispida TaxID=102211 RepID=UPI0018FF189F|nr:uncharacterized protein LOC120081277 isoform X2 [Benincasa hispida]
MTSLVFDGVSFNGDFSNGDFQDEAFSERNRFFRKDDKKVYTYSIYGGDWDENESSCIRGQLAGILVPVSLKYEEIKSHIYGVTNVSSSEFDLILKVKYKLEYEAPPQYIRNDDGIRFLLFREDLSRLQLSVTLKSNVDENIRMGFRNVSYDDTTMERQYKESYQYRQEEYDIPLSTNTVPSILSLDNDRTNLTRLNSELGGTSVVGNEIPYIFDYMDCGHPEQSCSPSVDVNEQPTGLNEMDRDHGDVRHSTAASVVPPSVSSSHRTELIMPGTSSFEIEDVEVGQLFFSKNDLKMRLSVLSINKNFEFRVRKSTKSLFIVKCIRETCK